MQPESSANDDTSANIALCVARIVAALPESAALEVLHFAQFTAARVAREAWDAALEGTTPEQAAKIRARIASQHAQATPLPGPDDAVWAALFAATTDAQWDALIAEWSKGEATDIEVRGGELALKTTDTDASS